MYRDPTYILWHPAIGADLSDHATFTVNVTPLAFDNMPSGPSAFFDTILFDIGLKCKAYQWSILPYRSNYHADRSASGWEDLWLKIWRVSISTLDSVDDCLVFEDEYFETHAYSIDGLGRKLKGEDSCLIIADFRSKADRDNAGYLIAQSREIAALAKSLGVSMPVFYEVDIGNVFFQLQICLGTFLETIFSGDFQYASAVESICRSCGGITSFDERADQWGEL